MKRPFDSVREIFFDYISKSAEDSKYVFEQSDKLIVWIVGFSIGGISLIVSNTTSIVNAIDYSVLRIILVLLTISVITGILYRVFFYLNQIYSKYIEIYLKIAFSVEKNMNINPDDISNETEINEIILKIKHEFGEDLTSIIDIYDNSDDQKKKLLLSSIKQHYIKTGEWAKKDFERAIENAKVIYKNAFGLSDKQTDKLFNKKNNSSVYLKIFALSSVILFIICCLAFIIVVILLCYNF